MKKLIVAVALLAITLTASAQRAVGSLTVKPMAGLNIAMMSNSDGADPRIGFVGGAELEYQVNDVLAFSGGLLYSQQGCKDSQEGLDMTFKMDYLNVPLLANFYVAKGLALKLGFQPGIKVNGKVRVATGGQSVEVGLGDLSNFDNDYFDSNEFSVSNVVLSLPVGLSYEYKNVVLDARYNWGITHALSYSDDSANHNVVMFTLGYRFSL